MPRKREQPDNRHAATPASAAVPHPPPKRRGGPLSERARAKAQAAFLTSYEEMGNITWACRAAGIDRSTYYGWMEHDEAFAFRVRQADETATDTLYAEAWRRAMKGVTKPVVSMGRVVFVNGKPLLEHAYSDGLLQRLIGRRDPEFAGKQHVEVSGSLNVNVLAAEADAKFRAYLAAATALPLLGEPERGTEG